MSNSCCCKLIGRCDIFYISDKCIQNIIKYIIWKNLGKVRKFCFQDFYMCRYFFTFVSGSKNYINQKYFQPSIFKLLSIAFKSYYFLAHFNTISSSLLSQMNRLKVCSFENICQILCQSPVTTEKASIFGTFVFVKE